MSKLKELTTERMLIWFGDICGRAVGDTGRLKKEGREIYIAIRRLIEQRPLRVRISAIYRWCTSASPEEVRKELESLGIEVFDEQTDCSKTSYKL